MMTVTPRYPRPRLEVECDQAALTEPGCCRYVRVVLRFCGVPLARKVRLEVNAQRMRLVKDGQPQHDYVARPTWVSLTQRFLEYVEAELEILARAHEETGTIEITMSSPAGGTLAHAILRFDSRKNQPVIETQDGFPSMTFVPKVRTKEERDALGGHLPFQNLAARPAVPQRSLTETKEETPCPSLWTEAGRADLPRK